MRPGFAWLSYEARDPKNAGAAPEQCPIVAGSRAPRQGECILYGEHAESKTTVMFKHFQKLICLFTFFQSETAITQLNSSVFYGFLSVGVAFQRCFSFSILWADFSVGRVLIHCDFLHRLVPAAAQTLPLSPRYWHPLSAFIAYECGHSFGGRRRSASACKPY